MMQNPALQQFIINLMLLLIGAGIAAVTFRVKRNGKAFMLIVAAALVGAMSYDFTKSKKETCLVAGQWVRFYDTPELCEQMVVDRMAKDSGVNGDPPNNHGIPLPSTGNIS